MTENEFLNIMNREFTHKTWRYELEKTPREYHYQLQFKDWILPDDFIFLDPPYRGSFTSYGQDFSDSDQNKHRNGSYSKYNT
jgi:16S rRNA G966 N2-methylase RsmD